MPLVSDDANHHGHRMVSASQAQAFACDGLAGEPDQFVRDGRMLMLVDDVYGVRPTHGLVVVAGGIPERVDFTSALERRVLATMAEMRAYLRKDVEPGPHRVVPKCRACGYREECRGVEKAS